MDSSVTPTLLPILAQGSLDVSADKDKDFFSNKIEKLTSMKFTEYAAKSSQQQLKTFQQALQPMRLLLADQPFFGGFEPSYADFAVAGEFAWARAVSRVKLLDSNDPVFKWRKRLFEKYQECVYGTVGYDVEEGKC
ncbi:TPA: hypothetical protein ACH3X3_006705 [Trebouxia sp. C0006]